MGVWGAGRGGCIYRKFYGLCQNKFSQQRPWTSIHCLELRNSLLVCFISFAAFSPSMCRAIIYNACLLANILITSLADHGTTHFCDMGYCNQPNAYSCDSTNQQCLCNPNYLGTYCENHQRKHPAWGSGVQGGGRLLRGGGGIYELYVIFSMKSTDFLSLFYGS